MTSSEIRQSFLDYFASRGHTVVPSASLLPTAPNLLFTNAGMNPFVPYFLGERTPPYPRAVDTQKCIRAGGKHNDLEDVGFDTYHQTFFEMLGNWSFGDYFKAEAIAWAWTLLTREWGMPKERLYATVYQPGEGEPASLDDEAEHIWRGIFESEGLDPEVHLLYGGKKDNFWMMGDTGPCGPCSEIHLDCTPLGDSRGTLVNADSPWCMEIWNLVFIQFNARSNGAFEPLKSRHVDTGMGFERVAGIHATTKGFRQFGEVPSNYNSDLFAGIFDLLAQKTGHAYGRRLPEDRDRMSPEALKDCAFRVLADHARLVAFAIADGILPGNDGRNYVIKRILRRGVLWARRLELPAGTLAELTGPVIEKMADVFPELEAQREVIGKVVRAEEEAFARTIDRGLQLFDRLAENAEAGRVRGEDAFTLYDTYGFPLDLTQLVARERGLTVDEEGFTAEMEKQRQRARDAQRKETIEVSEEDAGGSGQTAFIGYDATALENIEARLEAVFEVEGDAPHSFMAVDRSPFYAEMGGQVGDAGTARFENGETLHVLDTIKDSSGRYLHRVDRLPSDSRPGDRVYLSVDHQRRRAIQRHHTATHLLNWALREALGGHIKQAGSYVGPHRLRFDFTHFEAVGAKRLRQIERMVNECVLSNDAVVWYEVPMAAKPADVVAVFDEKYGDLVRVVDIGAEVEITPEGKLAKRPRPGYSAELCGGTHVRSTGEIGLFTIVEESAIAAGTRRIEAICGEAAFERFQAQSELVGHLCARLSCKPEEIAERVGALAEQRAALEKDLKAIRQKEAAKQAGALVEKAFSARGVRWVVLEVQASEPNDLRTMAAPLVKQHPDLVVVLGAPMGGKISILAAAGSEAIDQGQKAGDVLRDLASRLGGKGGGKPDFAMGGAPDNGQLAEALKALEHHLRAGA